MKNKIVLASRSGVRKLILEKNGIDCEVIPADIDEDEVKKSLLNENAIPLIIKALALTRSILPPVQITF